jgi:hypothetical protein
MKQVTAIIHLVKRGRTTTARYGQFLRPDKAPHPCATDLHLWLGRELSIQEFNEQLPKAIRSVLSTDTVYSQIIEREVPGDEPDAAALETLKKAHEEAMEALKGEHAVALANVQQGVNEFTAEHNEKLEWARDRIAELEAAIPAADPAGGETTKPEAVASEPASDTISKDAGPSSEVGEPPVVEAAPSAAGEQSADAAATPSDKPKAKAKDKPKAK